IAAAVGEPPAALSRQFAASKNDLMRILGEDWQEPLTGPRAAPAMQYREAGGTGFATLLKAVAAPPSPPAADAAPGDPPPAPVAAADGVLPSLRVTGISDDLYAGWSLLATGRNLARGQRIAIDAPVLLEPDEQGVKRMLVVDIAEIGNPNAETRHFLLKAYAIDSGNDGAGLRDSFHVGAPFDNAEARRTLATPGLSSIEIARCLWHDFATADDPGLCR
ncbi:MAG TPA: hypothetical protein VMB84_16085, partial [Stellaceae bacterium]|nr:hypothetical protein [Stellaceae bacterium]